MTRAMEADQVAAAYGRWAPIYDLVFGPVFRRGRGAAIEVAERIGGRILEVGVGTGISLPSYARTSRLVGVDISEPMLRKARDRVARHGLDNVEAIRVMDAEQLDFADSSFDVVVAQYVVTAVPNPERALDEFLRVVRPGGEIVVTTRVSADGGMRASIEKILMPLTSRMGFRTEFSWERYARWLEAAPAARMIERRLLPPMGHFSLLRFEKVADGVAGRSQGARRPPVPAGRGVPAAALLQP